MILEEARFFGRAVLHPIARKGLSIWPGLASRLLPLPLSSAFGEDLAFRHHGTSVGVDGVSSDLAVCVRRDPVAGVASGSISPGSDRRSTHALRTGNECPGNGQQCRVDARRGWECQPRCVLRARCGRVRPCKRSCLYWQTKPGLDCSSIGDIALLSGGILVVVICLRQRLERRGRVGRRLHH